MKLHLQNIGLIQQMTFDLDKKLTVLCGGNNTGKTYAAYAAYGALKYLDYELPGLLNSVKDSWELISNNSIDLGWVLSNLPLVIQKSDMLFVQTLSMFFAMNEAFFKESIIETKISFDRIKEIVLNMEFENMKINLVSDSTVAYISKMKNSLTVSIINAECKYGEFENMESDIFKEYFVVTMHRFVLELCFKRVYFQPVERAAISTFYSPIIQDHRKILSQILLSNSIDAIKKHVQYPIPITQLLDLIDNLMKINRLNSNLSYLSDEIENIVGGKVAAKEHMNKEQNLVQRLQKVDLEFTPKELDSSLSMSASSSMVKSLISIIFYCRHLAQSGDIIFIDEPELNLHPDNQRKVARVLAQMANAGIKVIISTHSDYIIRELNNLMMLKSSDQPDKAALLCEKYGYKENQLLDYNHVGAYLFTMQGVRELPVDKLGFEVESIDEEINILNRTAKDIFFTLHGE